MHANSRQHLPTTKWKIITIVSVSPLLPTSTAQTQIRCVTCNISIDRSADRQLISRRHAEAHIIYRRGHAIARSWERKFRKRAAGSIIGSAHSAKVVIARRRYMRSEKNQRRRLHERARTHDGKSHARENALNFLLISAARDASRDASIWMKESARAISPRRGDENLSGPASFIILYSTRWVKICRGFADRAVVGS